MQINYSFVYVGSDMWRIQWNHLFYNFGIQYGHQTGGGIDYNLHVLIVMQVF